MPLDATVIQMQASLPMKGLVVEQQLYRTTLELPYTRGEDDCGGTDREFDLLWLPIYLVYRC